MERAYRYRLYPTARQKTLFEKHFGAVRWVYNYGLERKVRAYQKDKSQVSCFDLIREIPELKIKDETKWLNQINAQTLQMAVRQLDNAFTRFFRYKMGFPKFKKKRNKNSFSIPQGNRIDFERQVVSFVKIGKVKARIDRPCDGRIIRATISQNRTDQYFVSYTVADDAKEKDPKNVREETTIGIDLGLKHFLVMSDGTKVENPKFLRRSEARLKVLHRRLCQATRAFTQLGDAVFTHPTD